MHWRIGIPGSSQNDPEILPPWKHALSSHNPCVTKSSALQSSRGVSAKQALFCQVTKGVQRSLLCWPPCWTSCPNPWATPKHPYWRNDCQIKLSSKVALLVCCRQKCKPNQNQIYKHFWFFLRSSFCWSALVKHGYVVQSFHSTSANLGCKKSSFLLQNRTEKAAAHARTHKRSHTHTQFFSFAFGLLGGSVLLQDSSTKCQMLTQANMYNFLKYETVKTFKNVLYPVLLI